MRHCVGTGTHFPRCKKYPSWVKMVAATKKAACAASKMEDRFATELLSSPRCLSSMYWEQGNPSSLNAFMATDHVVWYT